MKILHVIPSADPSAGGPIECVKQFTSVLSGAGHCTEVASLDAHDAPCTRDFPFPLHTLGPGLGTYGYAPRMLGWLQKEAEQFDVVVVNGLWQYHGLAVWRALRRSSTPYVVFPHGMLDPWFKRQYPLKHVKKMLYWPWAEYRVLRDASAVLFTCEEEKVLARQSFRPYRCAERIVMLGTAQPQGNWEFQRAAFFEKFPHLLHKRLVLFMGRVHPKKGCDLLIEAFAQTMTAQPDWHLVIAGPDQVGWQEKLSVQAAQRGIADRITWTGMLAGDLKWGAFHAADAFVLPSHQENFGIVVAEALACCLPVLISNKVNIWREIQQDGAGIVASDDLEGTCSLLRSWMGMSHVERTQMRNRAQHCFEHRFEINKAAESLRSMLQSAISQKMQQPVTTTNLKTIQFHK